MTDTVRCFCGAEKEIGKTSNVGEMMEQSGFYPCMTQDGGFHWFCPKCRDEAIPHIRALAALTKNHKYVSFHALQHMLEDAEKGKGG